MRVEIDKNKTAQCTLLRFWLIIIVFIIWFGAIGIRLVYLQVNQHDALRERAISQRRDRVKKKKCFEGQFMTVLAEPLQ